MVRATSSGTFYLVATPIGNRDDLSLRAISVLQSVDFILAEDTRHSSPLLMSYNINKPIYALHAHNEHEQANKVIERLMHGESCALISDAGTPLISDPGYPLVRAAHAHQIKVTPIPGACALIAALSASGVPCERFTFVGFLPAKQVARVKVLQGFQACGHTVVAYESTHRIQESLLDIAQVFGSMFEMVLAKELTKTYEQFITGTCESILSWLASDPARQKGEFVLILPIKPQEESDMVLSRYLSVLMEELPLKQAVKLTAKLLNKNKNDVYQLALEKNE